MDKNYTVQMIALNVGFVKKVCPVGNIGLTSLEAIFQAPLRANAWPGIQFCPKKAINYKDKTQNRKRYTHPESNTRFSCC